MRNFPSLLTEKNYSLFKSLSGRQAILLTACSISLVAMLAGCSSEPEKKAESISPSETQKKTLNEMDRSVLKDDGEGIVRDDRHKYITSHYMKTGREEDPAKYYLPQVKDNKPPETRAGKKEEFKVTRRGVKYRDLEEGFGIKPGPYGLTFVHYVGWLSNGDKFYSSIDKGMPLRFQMGDPNVPMGLQDGIIGMKVGGVRKLVVPPNLAYGSGGVKDMVPANETVTYVVKLLSTGRRHGGKLNPKYAAKPYGFN